MKMFLKRLKVLVVIAAKCAKSPQCMFDAECDLDGEALISAANFGPDALKEAIPSLEKCLHLLATIKNKVTIIDFIMNSYIYRDSHIAG